MLNRKKYSFYRHSPQYPNLFRKEAARLRKLLPEAVIEHVGSTSVPKLSGKGIIDISIGVLRKDIPKTHRKLQQKGYIYTGLGGSHDRIFLYRIIRYAGKERRVHVHLVTHNSTTWKKSMAVRDYLRNYPLAAQAYAAVKKKAVQHAKGEGERYRAYKKCFLDQLEKKALKEYTIQIKKK
ncbi:MAG: GrpB family protein [Nanoarchaeota archaeon]